MHTTHHAVGTQPLVTCLRRSPVQAIPNWRTVVRRYSAFSRRRNGDRNQSRPRPCIMRSPLSSTCDDNAFFVIDII